MSKRKSNLWDRETYISSANVSFLQLLSQALRQGEYAEPTYCKRAHGRVPPQARRRAREEQGTTLALLIEINSLRCGYGFAGSSISGEDVGVLALMHVLVCNFNE